MFVWVGVFAWIVGLLCAWIVRRFYGLWRVCLYLSLYLPLFYPFFIFFAYLLGLCLYCSRLVLLPALFVLVSLWVFCFLFPFRYMRKKRGRNSLRPLLLCCGLVYKSLNITVICCGSSFQCRWPSQMIPATSFGRFVGSFTICPLSSITEHLQLFRQSEGW